MTNMIDIDNAAIAFVQQQGGVVTVRLSPKHGCCGGLASVAVAETQAPNNPEAFQRQVYQGITLWVAPELAAQGLRIGVEGWWKLRHLYVDGAALSAG
ncbi:hypothetical protein GPL32_15485 [Halomonas alkaliphila]|uniref:FeS cluster biogenesis domain-containing protein n=2 Tax=Vreelandella alkaliphila TaxID=272774 RepID=A0A7C9JZ44_9GAMM|nr:hypothetical protein [Halomonas alkaliphila]